MPSSLRPPYRHVFVMRSGETIICEPREAVRTLDKRHPDAQPEVCWEITQASGLVLRAWPEDIASWSTEEVPA